MAEATTRAYTLRLKGNDNHWREQLWSTHVAVNRGAWAWGEWLLTLRGGLPVSLAGDDVNRRILLALSWLAVETPESLVRAPIVAKGSDKDRGDKVVAALREILVQENVENVDQWVSDCSSALSARIRDDAVWVNRHAAFAQLTKQIPGLTQDWAAATLFDFFGTKGEEEYFSLPDEEGPPAEAKDFVQKAGGWLSRNWGSGEKSDAAAIAEYLLKLADASDKDIVGKSGADAIHAVHKLLGAENSNGKKKEDAKEKEDGAAVFTALKKRVGWKGRSSKGAMALEKMSKVQTVTAELWAQTQQKLREESEAQAKKAGGQGKKPDWMDSWRSTMESDAHLSIPFRVDRDLIWEFGVMLDHALRKLSSAHSWIKRAEVSRRQFQEDAAKPVNAAAQQWLDEFCEQRRTETGSQHEYVIHRKALDGWGKVVDAWDRLDDDASELDRVAAARDVQANMENNEKLGDMTLFSQLASDDAQCVWRDTNGDGDPSILKNYSAAQVARHKQQRFKVPAFRHPDPLRHPIYVDFGNSRWTISYQALAASHQRSKLRDKLAKAKTDKTRAKLRAEMDEAPNLRGVTLGLWTDDQVKKVQLQWQGKRLWKDLDLHHFDQPGDATVTRADRMGRAVQNVPTNAVSIANVFSVKDWNGRLQVPRRQLNRLADLLYGKAANGQGGADFAKLEGIDSNAPAKRVWDHLRWFLTTSAKLMPSGPWCDLVESGLPDGIEYRTTRAGTYLHYDKNKNEKRKGRARFHLAAIPGLRVLSFDLGHRYGASCAVWETLTNDALKQEVARRDVRLGGIAPEDLYLCTEHIGEAGKPRRTIYRRTSPNMWARLERQFVVRLPGEDRKARWPTSEEREQYAQFRQFLGIEVTASSDTKPHTKRIRIDELQQQAVREARFGLRRLGDVARIAFAMTAQQKPISGGRTSKPFTSEQRIEYLAQMLARWKELAHSRDFQDEWAAKLWDSIVIGKLGATTTTAEASDETPLARKRRRMATIEGLKPIADQLVNQPELAEEMHTAWKARFRELEQEWKTHLKWLRKLILPRGGQFTAGNVGGLSVIRLQNIRGLYETIKAFRMRPEPDDLNKNVPELGDERFANFGRKILDRLEQLREQRIKQLASRVVEGALGAGRMPSNKGRDFPRPRTMVDKPCHVVVAENLERYRPEETRMRRENRGLMSWAARNVRKYIMEGCQLNGLHFEEVDPAYTSRQDSRTGSPGIRCVDVPLHDFMTRPFWRRQVASAAQKIESNKGDAREKYLYELDEHWKSQSEQWPTAPPVRIPLRGGELFVSADANSPISKGLQADLNAAANIGLKALMHPDFPATWWYVACSSTDGTPRPEKVQGCDCFGEDPSAFGSLRRVPSTDAVTASAESGKSKPKGNTKRRKKKKKEIVNFWSDISGSPLRPSPDGFWLETPAYWNWVQKRVVDVLRQHAGLDSGDD